MKISGFMIPAEKAATCGFRDTLEVALDAMIEKKIGSIVVLEDASVGSEAMGILTNADVLKAYQKGLALDTHVIKIMTRDLKTLNENMPKDEAAKFFEKSRLHHAIVTNDKGAFVGILSSWDISAENARDDRAWPWIRSEDGRFHHPKTGSYANEQRSPTSVHRESHAFLDYIDSVRQMPFMDD